MKTQIISEPIGIDHPSVKRVLEIAEEIMGKNKVLNIENLYNLAKKQLKIPRNGLLSIIQFLINKKLLIEGSKFSKETVLSNQIRRGIYYFIRTNPAIHFSVLRRKAFSETMGSSGQLVWHLEMLLKFNYIKKIKVGNYTVFLPFDLSEDTGRILFLLRDRINNKLMKLLTEENNVLKSEIYKEIDEKREDVYYRINNLINHDIITFSETSDKILCINSNVKENVDEILKTFKIYTEKNKSSKEEED
jgi:predicted transcriptional regulator